VRREGRPRREPRAAEPRRQAERQHTDDDRSRVEPADVCGEVRELGHGIAAASREPDERPKLIEDQHHRDAGEEAGHDRVRDEAGEAPHLEKAEDRKEEPGDDGEEEHCLRAPLWRFGDDRSACDESSGARRGDLHDLGAHERAPAERRGDARVQAVHGVHARERRRSEPVRNAHQGVDQPGERVSRERLLSHGRLARACR
jgi:hypothetical protein